MKKITIAILVVTSFLIFAFAQNSFAVEKNMNLKGAKNAALNSSISKSNIYSWNYFHGIIGRDFEIKNEGWVSPVLINDLSSTVTYDVSISGYNINGTIGAGATEFPPDALGFGIPSTLNFQITFPTGGGPIPSFVTFSCTDGSVTVQVNEFGVAIFNNISIWSDVTSATITFHPYS